LIVQDGATVIHLIVITVKYCSTGVVCAVSSISVVKVHTFHGQRVDTALLIDHNPSIVEYCDVLLPGDQADLVCGGANHHPGPVGAVPLVVDQEGLVVHLRHLAVLKPGAVHAVRCLDVASVAVLVVFLICDVGAGKLH